MSVGTKHPYPPFVSVESYTNLEIKHLFWSSPCESLKRVDKFFKIISCSHGLQCESVWGFFSGLLGFPSPSKNVPVVGLATHEVL